MYRTPIRCDFYEGKDVIIIDEENNPVVVIDNNKKFFLRGEDGNAFPLANLTGKILEAKVFDPTAKNLDSIAR